VGVEGDALAALTALADALNAPATVTPAQPPRPEAPSAGALTPATIAASLGVLMPENAIVVDEAATSGFALPGATAGSPTHDWLALTGGAIGQGLPTAVGAAVACPDRKVLCMQADGSAMYTVQALWTMAREKLDVVTVIFANRKYAILQVEFMRVGAHNPGPKAMSMLDLSNPDIDWVAMANAMGVEAERVDEATAFHEALARAIASPGPHLIEAVI
jgi:acetolactate synthase-1/2/3 large subunit